MKHVTSLSLKALAGVAALCLATQAHATLISIGLQQAGTNGGAISTVATDGGSGVMAYAGSYGTFTFNTIIAQGAPAQAQGSLSTSSIQTSSSSAGTITIYISETGLTAPLGSTSFLSSFTSQTFSGSAISVVESTLFDNGNNNFTGTQLASSTFSTIGTATSTNLGTIGGTYSETIKYVVTVGAGAGSVNDTVNLAATAAATPEPSSLIMLGTGLMSAAGMMVRRRKIS